MSPVDNQDTSAPGRSSFLQNLKDAGVIEENVFSFYLTSYDNYLNTSMFTIGGYDLDRYAPNSTVTWNYIENTNYWTVKLSEAMIGNQTIPLSTKFAVVDTGTSYLAMPTIELQSIVSYVSNKGLNCAYDFSVSLYQCICTYDSWQTYFDALNITLSGTNVY